MKKSRVWKIKGYEGTFTDEELVSLIRNGQVKKDYQVTTKDMKKWIKIEDSIYEYYLRKETDE